MMLPTQSLLTLDVQQGKIVYNWISFHSTLICRVGRPNDCSPNKLIKNVDNSILRRPVYQKLSALYDNYDSNDNKDDSNKNTMIFEENDSGAHGHKR